MKLSWLWLLLAVSLGVNVGILATLAVRGSDSAEAEKESEANPWDARTGPIADRLGLEGEDREVFMQLQRGLMETSQGHREEVERLRREVRKELREDEPDRERMNSLIEDMAEIGTAQERELVETVLATREMLDDEQEEMYMQFLAQMGTRGEGMRPGMQQRFRPGGGQQRMAPGAQQQRMRPGAQRLPAGPQRRPRQAPEQEPAGEEGVEQGEEPPDGG